MKKFILLIVLINLLGFKAFSQQFIIAGPQNDCAKGISKNVHTDSKDFDIDGYTKIKITTHQHSTFDNSKIFDVVNDKLLWEWKGESSGATWYVKEHFIEVNTKKIRVQFTQGFTDPFCNGYIKVEKISLDNQSVSQNIAENKALDNPKNIEIDCDECKDIVKLYYEAFNKRISFNSIDFFMMKGIVKSCYEKLYWGRKGLDYKEGSQDCGKKMKEQLEILTGRIIGGIEGDNIWNISRDNLSSINIKLKSEIINNFKKEYDKELIEDCSACKKSVNEYYEAWYNKQQIDPLEFEKKKYFVQKCQNQKATDCGSKMKKQLEILTGEGTGDIVLSKYTNGYDGREDQKWLILNKASNIVTLNTLFEDINKLKNGSQIFKNKDLYGVMDQNGFVYIYPKYKSLQYAKFGNSDYLIVNNSYIIDFNQNEVIKEGLYSEIIIDSSFNSFFVYKNSDDIGIVKYNKNTKTFNTKEIKLEYDDIFFQNNTCLYKVHSKYGFINSNGDELKFNETNSSELTMFSEINFKKPYWYCKNDNLLRVFFSSNGDAVEIYKVKNVYSNIFNFDTFEEPNEKSNQLIFAKVQLKDKFGLINQNFEEILAPQYDEVLKIQLDNNTKDVFVFVKKDNKYGSVNIEKSKIDNIYNISANYNSVEELENHIILIKEQIKEQRRIEEEKRLAEQRRIEEEKRLVENNKITIENLDIYYKDLGIFNYNDAVQICNELGDGWRLPTSEELKKIADNVGLINNLNTNFKSYTKPAGNYNDYNFDGSHYWGKDFKFIVLKKDVIGFGKVFDVMKGFSVLYYKSVRPVRINPEKEKIRIAEEKIRIEKENKALWDWAADYDKQVKKNREELSKKIHTCQWCSTRFKGIGFSMDFTFTFSGGTAVDGVDFCSQKCAYEYKSEYKKNKKSSDW